MSTITTDEAISLYKAIWEHSTSKEGVKEELDEFGDVWKMLLVIVKNTRWSIDDLKAFHYEDLADVLNLIKKRNELFDHLSKRYGIKHPDTQEKEFRKFMFDLVGDFPSALREYEERERNKQLKDSD